MKLSLSALTVLLSTGVAMAAPAAEQKRATGGEFLFLC